MFQRQDRQDREGSKKGVGLHCGWNGLVAAQIIQPQSSFASAHNNFLSFHLHHVVARQHHGGDGEQNLGNGNWLLF